MSSRKRLLVVLGAMGAAGLALAVLLAYREWESMGPWLATSSRAFWAWLEALPPVYFFTALAVLPAFPVPISPFYLIAGPLYGVGGSLLGCAIAIAANQTLSFWVASGVFRPVVARVVERAGYSVPTLRQGEHWKLAVVVRVTPGLPYFAQNLVLGLAGVPYTTYVAISWPTQMFWATVFLLLGESATEGSLGLAAAAVGLAVALTVVTRMVRQRLAAAQLEEGHEPP